MKRLVLILLLITSTSFAEEEKVDYVNLGAMLLKDGYVQRAKTVLDKVDVSEEGFDFARYYSLKGILLHRLSYPVLSNIFFEASREQGNTNQAIWLFVARNQWQLQDYPKVVEALDQAGEEAKKDPQMFVIKAEAYKQQGKFENAWEVLDEGIRLFPDESKYYSQKFYYLMELGFFQKALEYAEKYLFATKHSTKDYLSIAYALRENNQLPAAATLLEEALLQYRDDPRLIELLGQVYIDQEKYIMAALVFDWASIEHPEFSQKAATLYLKSKLPIRSLQLNRRILNQEEKFRQRLGIDIYLDDYETLVAKEPALKRYDLLKDDSIVYALGYGYFRNGDFDNAKKYLKQITDSQLFTKAAHIFEQIEKCKNDPFECY